MGFKKLQGFLKITGYKLAKNLDRTTISSLTALALKLVVPGISLRQVGHFLLLLSAFIQEFQQGLQK